MSTGTSTQRSRALELCNELLADLDRERVSVSMAIQRLDRIADLVQDKKVIERVRWELDGFGLLAASDDVLVDTVTYWIQDGKLSPDTDAVNAAKEMKANFPSYRKLSLSDEWGLTFEVIDMGETIAFYEELVRDMRASKGRKYTLSYRGKTYYWNLSQLSKLLFGAQRWVYSTVARIQYEIEFGQIPVRAIEKTFEFVDDQLFRLVPAAAERLLVAYKNVQDSSQENWHNVADTCRRVVKDFADAIYPPRDAEQFGLIVTDDKYLNRIRAFIKDSVDSARVKQQMDTVLNLLVELLARTDNLASRGVHSGTMSRFEAERILIYTYLAIGDVIVLAGLGNRPDTDTRRVSLNTATFEQLRSELNLSEAVAGDILKFRKNRLFQSWDEVGDIRGIGPKILQRLRDSASL